MFTLYEPRTGTIIDLSFANFISFFNSPYHPHRMGIAVDIYPREQLFLNPFEEAIVVRIAKVGCPRMRSDAVEEDRVVVLLLPSKIVAKVLHVDPSVGEGEKLYLHDPVGRTMITGFLYPWSEPHAHLELRPLHRPLGVLHGLQIKILRLPTVPTTDRIEGVVRYVEKHFVLIEPRKTLGYGPTPLVLGTHGPWIEGGYPYYGYVALHSYSQGLDLGITKVTLKNIELRRGNPFLGVGTYLGRSLIKVVLSESQATDLREGDILELSMEIPGKGL